MIEQRERLDPKIIIEGISPESRVYLSNLDILATIDSTNNFLLARFKTHPLSGQACFAEEQTHGKGRQGKEWFSPALTNIYCSLTWCFPKTFTGLSALSIACGAIIIQALKKLGVKDLGLKWPNDVYYSGRKLAGILLENIVSTQGNLVVIGIGLNLYLPPEKKELWAGIDEAVAAPVSRNRVASVLLNELLANVPLFQAQGLKPFLSLCHEHDVLRGQEKTINKNGISIKGVVQGISEQGELVLLDHEGCKHFLCSLD